MLIDGHIASWKTKGVLYYLKRLVRGDKIQIKKGNGKIIDYSVAKTQVYPANAVDMKALLLPITANKSGLTLILASEVS